MIDLSMLYTPYDIQVRTAQFLKGIRKAQKMSRRVLAERSGVPEATIKHFETTAQISLRQLLQICNTLGVLDRWAALVNNPSSAKPLPKTIEEYIRNAQNR